MGQATNIIALGKVEGSPPQATPALSTGPGTDKAARDPRLAAVDRMMALPAWRRGAAKVRFEEARLAWANGELLRSDAQLRQARLLEGWDDAGRHDPAAAGSEDRP